jgi:sec-independent protein translocase protein TatA
LDKPRAGRSPAGRVKFDAHGPGAYSVVEGKAAPDPTEERLQVPNIGLPELVIVLVIALVVFGPKRLPEMGRQLGKTLREFKSATSEIRTQIGVDDIADSVKDIKSGLSLTSDPPRSAAEIVAVAPVAAAAATAVEPAATVTAEEPPATVTAQQPAATVTAEEPPATVTAQQPAAAAEQAPSAGEPFAAADGDEGGVEAFGRLERRSPSTPTGSTAG